MKDGRRLALNTVRLIYKDCFSDEVGCAILIPKKNVKNSVDRNNLRRKIREVLYHIDPPKHSFVVIYNGPRIPPTNVEEDINTIIKKMQ